MRKLTALLIAVAIMLTFTSCGALSQLGDITNQLEGLAEGLGGSLGGSSGDTSGDTSGDSSGEPTESSDGETVDADEMTLKLPESYSITYEVMDYDNEKTYFSGLTRTPDGAYSVYDDTKTLYLKNGDGYDIYYLDENGAFVKTELGDYQLTEEDVEAYCSVQTALFTQYSLSGDSLKHVGDEKILGRDCQIFEFDFSLFGVTIGYRYSVDKETNLCLRYALEAAAGDEQTGYSFVCTEFKTSNVSLPAIG